MPRYFIDLHDGAQPIHDEVGFDLAAAARAGALAGAPGAAYGGARRPDPESRTEP
ncbi:DUF6894 family protein [Methylobacterium mesophilicum]|uniref:DUF6894 family protein n=1 Tax=Methylobacterium mesophilicum TaxID=39956 RepID=UPI002F35BCCC